GGGRGDRARAGRPRPHCLGSAAPAVHLRRPSSPAARDLQEAPAVRSGRLLVDVAIAVVVALIVLTIAPGVAIDGLLAIAVLAICGISLIPGHVRRRRR